MIDLHCHLLPGIDDGPRDVAAALEEARAHLAAGVMDVVCTPHVSHGYGNTSEGIAASVDALRAELDAAGLDLSIHAGAEVSLARAIELPDDELTALHLGDGPWLLLEPPLSTDMPRMSALIQGIQARGHRILIAHPERCAAFHHDAKLLAELVDDGALAQVTAGSLAGQFGRTVQKLARGMVDAGLVHVIASDAHNAGNRPPDLAGPLEAAGLSAFIQWSCHDVPAAILSGDRLPDGPPKLPAARRRFFGRG